MSKCISSFAHPKTRQDNGHGTLSGKGGGAKLERAAGSRRGERHKGRRAARWQIRQLWRCASVVIMTGVPWRHAQATPRCQSVSKSGQFSSLARTIEAVLEIYRYHTGLPAFGVSMLPRRRFVPVICQIPSQISGSRIWWFRPARYLPGTFFGTSGDLPVNGPP